MLPSLTAHEFWMLVAWGCWVFLTGYLIGVIQRRRGRR